MTESTPPEGQQPLTRAQVRQLRRNLTEKILERAESDPQWRELFLDDRELAMREADFPEARELEQQGSLRSPADREVVGHYAPVYGGYWLVRPLGGGQYWDYHRDAICYKNYYGTPTAFWQPR